MCMAVRSRAAAITWFPAEAARAHFSLHALIVIVFIMLALAVAGRPMATRIAPVLDPAAALPNLMLLHSFDVTQTLSLDFPSWSISAEWFLYLLFPTLAAFVLRIGPRGAIFAAIAFAMALALTRDAFDLRDWTRSTFDSVCCARCRAFLLA